ncbi:hypothetical protein Slin15195_G112550 [Septoria linicola]|uniref:Uncharacterized protein n=1 Tax=Septoria linicola TaxID=215465 RepID=A0A9Q9B6A6_9PEZI|nr:hypothetical protein Slin14017_G110910 [Septoria linicola]USW57936.1 hypothetical protein Slin15195_G112550 [Septoria linicola]
MEDSAAGDMASSIVENEVPGINISKRRRSDQVDDSERSPPKRHRGASLGAAEGIHTAFANLPDWNDDDDLLESFLQEDARAGSDPPETSGRAFTPINASTAIGFPMPQTLRSTELTAPGASHTASAPTPDDWRTTTGIVNGRTLDEIFTGDTKHISDSTLFQMSKLFTIPSIIERTNSNRREDLVAEPMLRKRLGDYKKNVLAADSKCAYGFEYELNKGRHDNGHKGVRMPPASLKCGNCQICLQWHDPVEPTKVFEWWTRSQFEEDASAGDQAAPALTAVGPMPNPLERLARPTAKRKRSVSKLPPYQDNGVPNDKHTRPSTTTSAFEKRKHSSATSPIMSHDSSSDSDSGFDDQKAPPPTVPLRRPLAAKSTNTAIRNQATTEQRDGTKRQDGNEVKPGKKKQIRIDDMLRPGEEQQ